MRLFGPRRPVTADTPLDGVQEMRPHWVDELSRAEVQSSIDRALRILDTLRTAGGYREHELQVVLQVCPAGEHYARWRRTATACWGAHPSAGVPTAGRSA